ncbi:efflux RND transporter periplasmic adaptor subunit [Aliikangiella sp. G2MR2-5]|uniref:efflux RND transporter periplasmic adaptor subunit n=1 Tax=Aliikangiella sp. G2MR2-5 TaxID=2788943 RepID=UPI0018A992A7|nr:HlyD family efflux transporter periplasmic adaptor subunit [Aliikangiella sp. G2MR2-5]
MDFVKPKTSQPFYKKRTFLIVCTGLILSVGVLVSNVIDFAVHSVESNSFITAQVRRGDLAVKVSAPGTLVPRDIQWVASNVEGKVESIIVKPGAFVKAGQLIAELANPELKRRVQELNWQIEEMEAETRALKERHSTRILDMEATALNNQMEYNKESIRASAEEELIRKGNATVSMLDFQSRKLTVEQLKKTLEMDKARTEQLRLTLDAEFEAQLARLSRLKNELERAKFQLESLKILSPVDGVLQAMPIDLGQRLAIGDNIAKLAKQDDLIAELRVPEFNALQVQVGKKVIVDTRTSKIEGKIIRVDPAVVEGVVQVDVELTSQLPVEARPDLSINGEIFIDEKPDTLFVRRPAFSQSNQRMSVFRLNDNQSVAEKINIQFGVSSSIDIEILEGLEEGDKIIVSEISSFENYKKIAIN